MHLVDNMQDSVMSLLHKLQGDVRDSQASMQKLKHDWREVRLSTQVEGMLDAADLALREEMNACLDQLWSAFVAEKSEQMEEAKEVQSSIYVENLWVTERQAEVAELEQRTARISKSLG
jgi:hypothetical protein